MRILEVESLIKNWFIAVIKNDKIPFSLIDNKFVYEDGMTLEEYWKYETSHFQDVASKFNLNSQLSVKVKNWVSLSVNKSLVLVYVFNEKGEFSFKMTITVNFCDNFYKISSNNSQVQTVAKYVIQNDEIKERGIAVHVSQRYALQKFLALDSLELSFNESPLFEGEMFYSGRYDVESPQHLERLKNFKVYLKNKDSGLPLVEHRVVLFDNPDFAHKPYSTKKDNLTLLDDKYPVNLFLVKAKDKELLSLAYPRGFGTININDYEKIIITDAQDNDWIVK